MSTISVAELLETSEQVLGDLQGLIVLARIPQTGPDRLRSVLAMTIAEQFEATWLLAKAQMSTHAATHARSMIEALVAMKMLAIDTNYTDQMKYEQLRGERRVCKGVIDDPDVPEGVKEPIKKLYEESRPRFDDLHAAGHRPKKISDDFGTTKLSHLVGPYSMFCSFSHSDLAALTIRHLGDEDIVYKQKDMPQIVDSILHTALLVLMDATKQLGEIAQFPDGSFDSAFSAMNQKWGGTLNKKIVLKRG